MPPKKLSAIPDQSRFTRYIRRRIGLDGAKDNFATLTMNTVKQIKAQIALISCAISFAFCKMFCDTSVLTSLESPLRSGNELGVIVIPPLPMEISKLPEANAESDSKQNSMKISSKCLINFHFPLSFISKYRRRSCPPPFCRINFCEAVSLPLLNTGQQVPEEGNHNPCTTEDS